MVLALGLGSEGLEFPMHRTSGGWNLDFGISGLGGLQVCRIRLCIFATWYVGFMVWIAHIPEPLTRYRGMSARQTSTSFATLCLRHARLGVEHCC